MRVNSGAPSAPSGVQSLAPMIAQLAQSLSAGGDLGGLGPGFQKAGLVEEPPVEHVFFQQREDDNMKRRVFVGGLHQDIASNDLINFCESVFGNVANGHVVLHPSGAGSAG